MTDRKQQLHDRIDSDFKYHPPREGQAEKYDTLRGLYRDLAHFLVDTVPDGRELEMALTDLERSVMAANAGIARHG